MKIQIVLAMVVALILTACTPQQVLTTNAADFKTFFVTLDPKPNPAPGRLKVLKGPQGWDKGNKKDGYVGFDMGQSGVIIFALKKEDSDDTCSDSGLEGEADWVISKIELSTKPDPNKPPGSEKGLFPSVPDAWLVEAFPGVTANGQIFPGVGGGFGNTTVVVQNANNQEGYKFIYYQVTASPCHGGVPVMTDPGVGNGGRR